MKSLATETYGSGANRSEAENPAPTPRVSIGPTPINDRAPAKVTRSRSRSSTATIRRRRRASRSSSTKARSSHRAMSGPFSVYNTLVSVGSPHILPRWRSSVTSASSAHPTDAARWTARTPTTRWASLTLSCLCRARGARRPHAVIRNRFSFARARNLEYNSVQSTGSKTARRLAVGQRSQISSGPQAHR